MRGWIRFLLRVNYKLDKMCSNVERKIDRLSKNLDRPTEAVCADIFDWTDFKRRLVNLRVLHQSLFSQLNKDEWESLTLWRQNKCSIENDLARKCERILLEHGYGQKRFDEDYLKNKKLLESFSVCIK